MPKRRDKRPEALLNVAASEVDSNIYYATRFVAPDPFVFLRIRGRLIVVMSDLELGRARDEARVEEVLALSKITAGLLAKRRPAGLADVIAAVLRERGIQRVVVPASFGLHLAEALRRRRIAVEARPDPFFPEREVKSTAEIRCITRALRATEEALGEALHALRRAPIRGNEILLDGAPLTAEGLRRIIDRALLDRDLFASRTIVACGDQGCDPHSLGTGPLRPHQSIVIDVFPRDQRTFYWADITRTVVKGRAPEPLRRLFADVHEAQRRAIRRIRHGARGPAVHAAVVKCFAERGYRTESRKGKMVGFFHGTGHGLGLDVHETPRIAKTGARLRAGNVVTVEPGLYYPGIGAVRLEDLVVVTRTGCRNLTRFPIFLEIP